MEDKFLCVMAGYDEPTEKELVALQRKLYDKGYVGEHTKGIPQHITLGTFEVSREREIKELVKAVSESTEAFHITFSHIGLFTGGKVLFIAPDMNRELLELKEKFGESRGWAPHTTMLIDEPEVIHKALPVVVENFKSFEGRIECIYLYEFWPTRFICTGRFHINK